MSKALLHMAHKMKSKSNNPDEMRYDIYVAKIKKENETPMTKKQFDTAYERMVDYYNHHQVRLKVENAIREKLHALYPKLISKGDSMYEIKKLTHGQFEEAGYGEADEAVKLIDKFEDQSLHLRRLHNSINIEGQHKYIIEKMVERFEDKEPMEYIKKHEKDYMKQAVNLRDEHGVRTRPPRPITEI
jgi:hypothetical protein